jgi:hypothetical protein
VSDLFRAITLPLEVVQIGHTLVDEPVVDELECLPLGRPNTECVGLSSFFEIRLPIDEKISDTDHVPIEKMLNRPGLRVPDRVIAFRD